MMRLCRRFLPAVLALALAGCSWFGPSKPDYKGAQARADQPLEVPPGLSAPTMDDRYSIPDPHAQTAYSEYEKEANAARGVQGAAAPAVLPPVKGAKIVREGNQRWLEVKGDPGKVWTEIRQFWIDNGYSLSRESPDIGIMETQWHEDRAKIPQDFIRRTIGRAIDGVYSTPYRDKYRVRLEKGEQPGTTDVFVTHRGMQEVYTDADQTSTKWEPMPPSPELEAEMLSRIMVKLGGEETKVAAGEARAPAGRAALAQAQAPTTAPAHAVLENSGAGPLVLGDGFDRAWRRVGLALDRTGFTVVDRDRSKGLFFVRYIDPETQDAGGGGSFLGKLAFWRPSPKEPKPQYRILVSDAGASTSEVKVQDANGAVDTGSTGKKILSVLYEQLK